MDRRRLLKLSAASAGALALLYACTGRAHALRYRLTITVQLDGDLIQGASVIETRWTEKILHLVAESGRFGREVFGEAVVIDLGSRGLLFGLLEAVADNGFCANRVEDVLSQHLSAEMRTFEAMKDGTYLDNLATLEGEFRLSEMHLPTLVRFKDPRDPKSAEFVKPKDFPRIYGARAAFAGATIRVSSEPITRGIDEILPWVDSSIGSLAGTDAKELGLPRAQWSASAQLLAGHFKRSGW